MACRNPLLVVLKMHIGIEAFYIDDRSQTKVYRAAADACIVMRMRILGPRG